MPCHIVVGGQYGSEGKGKVAALLAQTMDSPWVVRCGGPNSGHTVTINGEETILRQIPTAVICPSATLVLPAGCSVSERVLLSEIKELGITPDRIILDPRAVLITDADEANEQANLSEIASTCTGVGSALIRRISRSPSVQFAADSRELRQACRIEPVAPLLHSQLDAGRDVLLEGTQGFGLSIIHGSQYPYVTSRDTTAMAFASEVGIPARDITAVTVVVRTFPIRVGGPSGPLPDEIDWEELQRITGAPQTIPEFTSVTRKLRRVARFNMTAVKIACRYNGATGIAIMGLDRLDFCNFGVTQFENLAASARIFVEQVEKETGIPVTIVGTGFSTTQAIHLKASKITGEAAYV